MEDGKRRKPWVPLERRERRRMTRGKKTCILRGWWN
jgi:hypothetical protein